MLTLVIAWLLFGFGGHTAWGAAWEKELLAPTATSSSRTIFFSGMLSSSLLGTFGRESVVYPIQEYFQQHHQRPLGRAEPTIEMMGRWAPNLVYAVGMEVWGLAQKEVAGEQRALMMIKATSYASLLTVLLKNTVRQKRPVSSRRTSFPSGHTTTSFAFAGVVGAQHAWYWGIAAYTLASLVGVQRISSNSHYLQDVLAGAAIGSAYGIGISHLAAGAKASESATSSYSWGIYPLGAGAMVQLVFNN